MRVPGNGKPGWDKEGPCHYLTDFYVNHFQLPTIPFLNSDPDDCTYFKFYDDKPIQKKGTITEKNLYAIYITILY